MNRAWIITAAAFAVALTGCVAPVTATPSGVDSSPSASAAGSAAGVACSYQPTADAARKVELPPATGVANTGTIKLAMSLSGQPVGLSLDQQRTPCTTNSFVSLAAQGYFDNTACHRLVDSNGLYVLQCGDPSGTGSGGPGYQFADELTEDETYGAGTLAMANAGPDTNGSQFFIVYADSMLPPSYTVFGTVDASGLKVIEKIAASGQDNSFGAAGGGKPNAPAMIESIKLG